MYEYYEVNFYLKNIKMHEIKFIQNILFLYNILLFLKILMIYIIKNIIHII